MPYVVRKRGNRWAIVKKTTGAVVGTSDSKEKAQSSVHARNASEYGWKPTGKKRIARRSKAAG